jgi:glycosyltransferase involved in cell wall biosynthesis
MEKVTVLIPVGPNYNKGWLKEAFDSVLQQSYAVNEILLIDDGANLSNTDDFGYPFTPGSHLKNTPYRGIGEWHNEELNIDYYIYFNPCNLGFTASFNIGMALAHNNLVVYLAADDRLMPTAIERAVQTYLENNRKDAWYAFAYETSKGNSSSIPCNAAMITKNLWEMIGGYPPAAFVGPDAAILSCLMAHASDRIIRVDEGIPLYWIREHEDQETKTHTWEYVDEMNSIRNKLTAKFRLKTVGGNVE